MTSGSCTPASTTTSGCPRFSSSQLGLPRPDVNLGVGSGSHARQTAEVLTGMEREFTENSPALAVVYGDVNSTLGAALAAAKLGVPLAHVEAGLRSFDDSMPEEINRRLTDQLCSLLFATSPEAIGHLAREGRPASAAHLVGNPMIDTLLASMDRFDVTAGPDRVPAAGQVRGRDLAPAVQRGRPGGRRHPGAGPAPGGGRAGRGHPVASPGPRRARGGRSRRAPTAAHRFPARLPGVRRPGPGRQGSDHRLRRRARGDHAAPGAVPDPAAQHRAAGHHSPTGATAWSAGPSWPRRYSRPATTDRTRASCRRCGTVRPVPGSPASSRPGWIRRAASERAAGTRRRGQRGSRGQRGYRGQRGSRGRRIG